MNRYQDDLTKGKMHPESSIWKPCDHAISLQDVALAVLTLGNDRLRRRRGIIARRPISATRAPSRSWSASTSCNNGSAPMNACPPRNRCTDPARHPAHWAGFDATTAAELEVDLDAIFDNLGRSGQSAANLPRA
jgi:hypothetical protein